jgi:thiamine biosynthesis lipoprotein
MREYRFRAMGTEVAVLGPVGPHFSSATAAVRRRFATEERRFSRFRMDSELSRVNQASGTLVRVSGGFAEVTRLALVAARRTGGLFDPTVHDALVAAGYDRDFDEVLAGARGALHAAVPCGRWREVRLDGDALHLPPEVHLDFGGIAKGWTSDRAAEDALATGLPWVLVNAGGDLRLEGDAPAIDVSVEDPEARGTELLRLKLTGGALATSSVAKRSWAPGKHHVIDPRTGKPAGTDLLQATVWAPTCARAEVLATQALLLGRTSAPPCPAIIVSRDGEVAVSMPFLEAA